MRRFLFFVTVLGSVKLNAVTPPANLASKIILVESSGAKLHTILYPNPGKETVLLLHGGPGFPDDLVEVASTLKADYQVITFHQRGTKLSPCSSRDYSMEAYISDVKAIQQYFGLSKFHLWGHSWGGLYAQIYADKHSEDLLSLFLCCPGSGTNLEWKQTENEVLELNRSKCTSWQWAKMGWNNVLGLLGSDKAYRRLFTQVMKNYNARFSTTATAETSFSNLKAEPINKTRPEIVKYKLLARQENSAFCITIVYGDKDIYKASKAFVLNRYPTAQVETIYNCGHIPWLHNPTAYYKILRAHFRQPAL